MRDACIGGHPNNALGHYGGAVDWLGLAAAPVFAIMALLTAVHVGGPLDRVCSTLHDVWPFGGMVPMYILMSVFHCSPWVRLIATRRTPR